MMRIFPSTNTFIRMKHIVRNKRNPDRFEKYNSINYTRMQVNDIGNSIFASGVFFILAFAYNKDKK